MTRPALPEKLEQRIFTASMSDFLKTYSIPRGRVEMRSIQSSLLYRRNAGLDHNTADIYAEMAKRMAVIGAIAVTDVRMSEAAMPNTPGRPDSYKVALYGTAILERKAEQP